MSKKPRSFTVDEEIHEELKRREGINASGVVNEFLREYLDTSADNHADAMVRQIKREIREVDSDIEDLEAKRTEKIEQLEEWKDKRDNIQSQQQSQREELFDSLRNTPADETMGRVIHVADELDMTTQEVVNEMQARFDK